jgi:hypothetical protein
MFSYAAGGFKTARTTGSQRAHTLVLICHICFSSRQRWRSCWPCDCQQWDRSRPDASEHVGNLLLGMLSENAVLKGMFFFYQSPCTGGGREPDGETAERRCTTWRITSHTRHGHRDHCARSGDSPAPFAVDGLRLCMHGKAWRCAQWETGRWPEG